ncbi:hypothetical protein SDRG_07828 [Saprolegnia diclina VS20]|uniref:Uncharacterized protein n=1 Tax=Saprolegnia diclina (strain VS20) TaxID=1156394 RepID=T0QL33_SAPDV|nr:hypothetical protein SDRG_07828 [Saprolegnia diclina VS20]EQC34500.1 hypothetical protein SDRG_07828 [Saprolegnia diclina VS20]|eukprot:XP_008611906.1 hypothetical protein SDRG_07828 [Saprolegnia diclina VS20]
MLHDLSCLSVRHLFGHAEYLKAAYMMCLDHLEMRVETPLLEDPASFLATFLRLERQVYPPHVSPGDRHTWFAYRLPRVASMLIESFQVRPNALVGILLSKPALSPVHVLVPVLASLDFRPTKLLLARFLDRLVGQTVDVWFALDPNAPTAAFQALVWPATRSVVLLGCDAALRGLETNGEDQDVLLYFYPSRSTQKQQKKKQKTTAGLHDPAHAIVTCFRHTDARLVARLLRVVAKLDAKRLFATLLRDHIAVLDADALSYAVQTLGPVDALPGLLALVLRAAKVVPSLLSGVVAWTSQLQDEYLAKPLTTLCLAVLYDVRDNLGLVL